MLKLVLTGIVGLVVVIIIVRFIKDNPDLWFWIFLNLFFDPGGYIEGFLEGKLIGPFNIKDVFFVGIIFCLINANINWKIIFSDQFLKKFLLFLFIFAVYYYVIYGGVTPYLNNDLDYSTFLMKNRYFIYGIIILISVYAFSLRGLKYFYTATLFIGITCLSLYLITLLTGFKLAYVWELEREGTEMTRITILSYGLFDLLFPVALITYIVSKKINLNLKYKHWLYVGGIMMVITIILTLTRRMQMDVIAAILIIVLIISYLFRIGKLSSLLKITVPVLLVILVLYFTFPKYIGFLSETMENTFLLITTGKDAEGESDYRVSGSGDLDVTKEYIENNLLLGTGYSYLYWGPGFAYSTRGAEYARAADAAGEVPIYYFLFGFGIIGALLMLPLYFLMVSLFFRLIKYLRADLINYLQEPLIIIFSIFILLTIAIKFTTNLYQFSSDFTGPKISMTAVYMGIGFALYRIIYLNLQKNE